MNQTIEAPRIFVTRRYRNSKAMIDWLEKAFGFARHYVVDDGKGGVAHAQIAFGSAMMMLGDHHDDDFSKSVGAPGENAGGQSIYLAVDDIDALYARAREAGAVIERELEDTDYGSREFGCRDPEGQFWNFGTYWPKVTDTPES
ncbi:VOC family protein [Minwuia sp.]|uniref:VOC family protein n=1 Tax=Minwuia sp. TaxID=2493630 RepID=UPI003A92CEA1